MDLPKIASKSPQKISIVAGKTYWWCTCGLSENQPFCDGKHKGTDFKPMKYSEETESERFLCCCKHSQNPPFCDGSHAKL